MTICSGMVAAVKISASNGFGVKRYRPQHLVQHVVRKRRPRHQNPSIRRLLRARRNHGAEKNHCRRLTN